MDSFLRVDLCQGLSLAVLPSGVVHLSKNWADEPICQCCGESTEKMPFLEMIEEYEIQGVPDNFKNAHCFHCSDCGHVYFLD